MTRHFAMSQFNTIKQKRLYTIFTSAVSHEGMLHLIFNCAGIWFFGPFAESMLGAGGMLGLYTAGAIGGFLGIRY
jgi:membrane associated rhomboid family serine protease